MDDASAEAFPQTSVANKCCLCVCVCVLEMEAWGGWGSWDMQTTLRQPVCKGMLVLLSSLYIHLFTRAIQHI